MRGERASRQRSRGVLLVVFALFHARPLHAETERQAIARRHFEKGYRLVEQGALDAAIDEFEQAYRQSPHFSVLYNLGQAYAALGKSVEAVERFERYLELGGPQINDARAQQVRELTAYHARRIGSLVLEVRPAGARVSIDGKAIESAALAAPIRLNPGLHAVVGEHAGYATAAASVRIEAGATARALLELAPLPPVSVSVTCAIPDVVVMVDGVASPLPPTGSLRLPPGEHRLEFRRPGYLTRQETIGATTGNTYDCALKPDPKATEVTRLRVRHPRGTTALVDGAPHAARPLPEGRHHLSVSGPGFESAAGLITLRAHRPETVDLISPRSSAVLLAEQRSRDRTRKVAGLAAGGVGLAAGLVAGGLYVYNTGEYDDWLSKNGQILERFRADPGSVSGSEIGALFEERNRIFNRDAVVVGVGVFGLVSLAAATVLLLWPSTPADAVMITGSRADAFLRF
jgi:hypothetical protein